MSHSYFQIDSKLANNISLIMTDVDGTITDILGYVEAIAQSALRALIDDGITVGFVSGRTLPRLEPIALEIGINGPIIGENGGIAKLKPISKLLDLGYSREPALKDLERLKNQFPNAITPTEDDADRLVDIGFKVQGVATSELKKHLKESELLDSGYMLHLLHKGISKGGTLKRILPRIGDGKLSPEQVMVFGDSLTDISLFRAFPHSVFIRNNRLPSADRAAMDDAAEYVSRLEFGAGFARVARHILGLRR
jgi:hydroxymethylpyrimidine pyrophosphatase-like HAD family hydrolase